MLARLPNLTPAVSPDSERQGEKWVLYLHDHYADRLPPSLPLKALIAPTVKDQASSELVPVKALAVIRALAPSTMEQISGPDPEAWRTMVTLARQLPCFRLNLGKDVTSAPARILELLEEVT